MVVAFINFHSFPGTRPLFLGNSSAKLQGKQGKPSLSHCSRPQLLGGAFKLLLGERGRRRPQQQGGLTTKNRRPDCVNSFGENKQQFGSMNIFP
jgi:hypothetical protein